MNDWCCTVAGVAVYPWWIHAAIGFGIAIGIGLPSFIGVGLLVDGPATRHAFFHPFKSSKNCGRCDDDAKARAADREFSLAGKRAAQGPVTLSLVKPEREP